MLGGAIRLGGKRRLGTPSDRSWPQDLRHDAMFLSMSKVASPHCRFSHVLGGKVRSPAMMFQLPLLLAIFAAPSSSTVSWSAIVGTFTYRGVSTPGASSSFKSVSLSTSGARISV